ncbi:hypothetical protein HPP92_003724 [Vanilla planifolia]|uniref:Translation machinery-associated protein 7 homolog n=1 Tax=Vanilla planifolia TaxID=51239 RepID=A0A835RY51_VANPL|nr:hypothetical protein HPP92_003724 [Vanilla planifolia]
MEDVLKKVIEEGNNDPSFPGGDGPQNGESKSDDSKIEPRIKLSDWRYFRATLVAREQANLPDSDAPTLERAGELSQKPNPKWAHPLPVPEAGCVLVATEKLDGVHSFERTVVLLHRLGTRGHRKGPSGVIINRPLHKKIKHMKPSNPMLDTTFADCPLHFGGPFDDTMFLLNTTSGASSLPGLEEVIPGICFGSLNCLDEAAALVNKGLLLARDFRFFIGYAGWDFEQLRYEIESNYWVVAACSSQVIVEAFAHSCSSMWEDILQLMGDAWVSRIGKPKRTLAYCFSSISGAGAITVKKSSAARVSGKKGGSRAVRSEGERKSERKSKQALWFVFLAIYNGDLGFVILHCRSRSRVCSSSVLASAMSSKQGGKAKPLKQPKADKKEYDDDDLAHLQKKKDEEKALKELRAKATQKGTFGGAGLKKSGGKK